MGGEDFRFARDYHQLFPITMAPIIFPEKVHSCCYSKRSLRVRRFLFMATGQNVRDWLYVEDHAEGVIIGDTKGSRRAEL